MPAKFKLLKTTVDVNNKVVPEGSTVYECTRATYGCIGPHEIACTQDSDGDYPFFGVCKDQLEKIN